MKENDAIEYNGLISKIKAVDRKAALFLMKKMPLANLREASIRLRPRGALDCCIIWSCTPQGQEYWDAIFDKLCEEFNIDWYWRSNL